MPSNNLGIDVGTTGGSWLFKQGDLLLGPVPFTKLVPVSNRPYGKLYAY